jgi:hypothetical protein
LLEIIHSLSIPYGLFQGEISWGEMSDRQADNLLTLVLKGKQNSLTNYEVTTSSILRDRARLK